jgi:hypothetical protein
MRSPFLSRAGLASSAGDGFLSLAVAGVPVPTTLPIPSMLRVSGDVVPHDRRRILGASA